jgi:hypothetical protein
MQAADAARGTSPVLDAPMLKNTSVWQQLAQYKSQDRVRLLTLWKTQSSTLSLQAGRHGAPSLQWSTHWVKREDASRGLLDRLFSPPSRNTNRSTAVRPASALVSAPAPSARELTPGFSTK